MPPSLGIIIASTRPGRIGLPVAEWFITATREHGGFDVTVLGLAENPNDPNKPEHEECLIQSPDGSQRILFIDVPEAKQVKNRIHFDLEPADTTRDAELQRLVDLGASQVD